MRIGVLDDKLVICQLLETLLSFAGYLVYASTDPADFLKKICDFECIIVDYQFAGKKVGDRCDPSGTVSISATSSSAHLCEPDSPGSAAQTERRGNPPQTVSYLDAC